MKNMYRIMIVSLFAFFTHSCGDSTDLDLQENPDELTLESADPDLIFNSVQGNMLFTEQGIAGLVEPTIRLRYNFSAYLSVFTLDQSSMNGAWNNLYTGNNNIDALGNFVDGDDFTYHYGAGLVSKASNFLNVTDAIGTAVYIQANDPLNFPNPELDGGQLIYDSLIDVIDAGIELLGRGGRVPTTDIFTDGDASLWIKFANSLKLRMWLQTRLVNAAESTTAINALIADGNLIDDPSEDFEFQYGTTGGATESRHPDFVNNYLSGANEYMPNGLMSYMKDSTTAGDPRLSYYFYRQTLQDPLTIDPTGDLLPCQTSGTYPICYVEDGHWGRDHCDDEGLPGDNNLRSVFGAYPAGGAYDDGAGVAASTTSAGGNGIFPMMLSSWTNFMLAEAALTLGTTGDPRTYLETGIREHMAKVLGFADGNATQTDVDDYVTEVLADYDAAANDAERLDIIMTEWYISSWGNGMMMYSAVRRNGLPSFVQSPVIAAGNFPRSLFLPESELNSNANPNLEQKAVTDKLFWDTNPDGFID